jgi:hypothetical protein
MDMEVVYSEGQSLGEIDDFQIHKGWGFFSSLKKGRGFNFGGVSTRSNIYLNGVPFTRLVMAG